MNDAKAYSFSEDSSLVSDLADYITDIERTRTFGEDLYEGIERALASTKFEGELETILLEKIGEGDRGRSQSLLRRVADYKMLLGIQRSEEERGGSIVSRIATSEADAAKYNARKASLSNGQKHRRSVEL